MAAYGLGGDWAHKRLGGDWVHRGRGVCGLWGLGETEGRRSGGGGSRRALAHGGQGPDSVDGSGGRPGDDIRESDMRRPYATRRTRTGLVEGFGNPSSIGYRAPGFTFVKDF